MNDPTHTEADETTARAEVQQILSGAQTQALYDALVGARIEVAQLRRQLAESTAPDVIAGQP